MALPILDGNQTAATLSTIITGGAHIPAHTVVSLGSQAISDITSGVSGSVVSISNFPATQTIAGTVTANVGGIASGVTLPVRLFAEREGSAPTGEDRLVVCNDGGRLLVDATASGTSVVNYDGEAFVRVKMTSASSVTVGNSVTIGSLPAISGTVTVGNSVTIGSFATSVTARLINPAGTAVTYAEVGTAGNPSIDVLSIQGVTSGTAVPVSISSVTIGAVPNGALTTRFGSVTTANTAQISSAVTNASRKYLLIQNVTTSSNVITVGIGFTPTTTQGIQLSAGGKITFESSYIPTGAVYVLSSVTASPFTIIEA